MSKSPCFALPVLTLLTFTSLASRLFIGLTPIFASGKFGEIFKRRRRLKKTWRQCNLLILDGNTELRRPPYHFYSVEPELLNRDHSWHSHRPRHSFKLFQWSTWPKITQLQEDHWALIRPATLERPPPVRCLSAARRNCFLSNVQTVPPPRTTSITDTTDNRVQLVGMSLSNLARSDEWKHNVDYRFGNPNMNFRNIGIQVPPPAI